jgi:adenosylcobinamide-phosphate synthase
LNRMLLLSAACLLDDFGGDPEWFPHPVRLMGVAITRGENALRSPDDSATQQFVAGATLSIAIVTLSYITTRAAIRWAHRNSCILGHATELLLAWTTLAACNLREEAESVLSALLANDLSLARARLTHLVGRDTATLDASEISRALIESLAESASDGIVAPLLYLALGGVPLAMSYKAVNTLDSMIGHTNRQYFYFGKFAARLDDAANYIPARLAALSLVAGTAISADLSMRNAWHTWLTDADSHKSPNAGQPEAAVAGALAVRLGGDNYYDGELITAATMGTNFAPPTPQKARDALGLITKASLFALAGAMCLAACLSFCSRETTR